MYDGNDQEGDAGLRNLESHGNSRDTGGPSNLVETRPEEVSPKRNRNQGGGRDLDSDLLAGVFSHLPQKDLFDVMFVSRD